MRACILLPVHLQPLRQAKLQVAQQQAQAHGAPILLLHVLPPGALESDAVSASEARARAQLDSITLQFQVAGVEARPLVRAGGPARVIVEEAQAHEARLIVLGNSIRGRLPRALLGSVADAVIHDAPCPVLLVRTYANELSAQPLLTFDPPDVLVPRALGRRMVNLARVVGSATRAQELRQDFRLLHPTPGDEQRFQSVLSAMARGEELPPVELYKLGFGYYVRDGHHRVAAALALGRKDVLAQVIELAWLDDPEGERLFAARQSFEASTGLRQIGCSRAESYARLQALIEDYRTAHPLEDPFEAAQRWFEETFRPLWRRVRALGLARHFPGERPSDVIARMVAWQAAQTSAATPGDLQQALERFAASLAGTPT